MKKTGWFLTAMALMTALSAAASDVVLENRRFRLVVDDGARAKSLKLKGSGEELLCAATPLFSVTQARPYNNEIKLIHPNRRTTYPANRLRRVGDRLVVGFQTATYEAEIGVKETDDYIVFSLERFLVDDKDYAGLKMDTPPAKEFRVLQLPVKSRKRFGNWLNCAWDDSVAVAVVGTSPFTVISNEECAGGRILYGDLLSGRRMLGGSAALMVAGGREDFLDAMDAFERAFSLPRGVKNRRDPLCGAAIYHEQGGVVPGNVDEYIAVARAGGFRCMTLNDTSIVKGAPSWGRHGDYDLRDEYANGLDDVKAMLAKIHAAGIKVGLHVLHTHIGLESRYVTPRCDARLNLRKRFTLAAPLPCSTAACEIAVLERTEGAPMHPGCRLLRFGAELVSYESYSTEPPYVFRGCRRGAWKTEVVGHPAGECGGVLDVSEYGEPRSCYVGQDNDLQDEVADKIAAIYNCGFDYIYLDGSEGVDEPFDVNVALAQHRVWKKLVPEPFCAEGAAKTHFGWHMLSGANAFDIFAPHEFKAKLLEFPCAQAPLSQQDMTRLDFGWWNLRPETTPDLWEFGEAKATGWDCAASFIFSPKALKKHSRSKELMDTIRRWEDAKAAGFFTPEIKARLRDPKREFRLLRRPDGSFELEEDASGR